MRSAGGKPDATEAEVFALVVRGKLNKQIAHELGTTVRTIKAHRQAVMEKLRSNRSPRRYRLPSAWACSPNS